MTVENAIREFLIEIEIRKYTPKTRKGYKNNLSLFSRFLGNFDIEDLTLGEVKRFTAYMVERGKKGTYINGILKCVKSFIQYCFEEGYGGFNTKRNFKWCKEDKPVIVTFQPQDVKKLLADCRGGGFLAVRDKAIITTFFETGIRNWELCNIQPQDIHDDFIVINGKNHKQRVVPVTPVLKKALSKYDEAKEKYFTLKNTDEYYEVYGIAASLGSRLKWPDSYFVLYHELSWQTYNLHNWSYNFLFENGRSNNISYKITLARNSTDQVVYPREGSDFQLSLQLTPPYSLFRDKNTDYASMTDQQRYRWIEYHKWTFKGALYVRLFGDLVLMTRAQFGYLGYYNKNLGYSPFEGYQVGGDGMSGYNTYGSEIIALRGYQNYSLTPVNEDGVYVGHVYDKFTIELRYPVILQPQSTIYVLAFLEGGNCWEDIREFNPFQIKRSAGVGVRVMLPMIGLLGVDWGWGFDPVQGQERGGSNFHFVIGQQF